MVEIYGVDTEKGRVTAVDVRGAIVECFTRAHKEIIESSLKGLIEGMDKESLAKLEKVNIELMIKEIFNDIGADYENPTKQDLVKVCDKLAEFAKDYRSEDLIKKHYREIMRLLEKVD